MAKRGSPLPFAIREGGKSMRYVPPRTVFRSFSQNRIMRMAIAAKCMGTSQSYFGVNVPASLVDDGVSLVPLRPKASCVYVIGAAGAGLIKVGWSGDLVSRLRTVSGYVPFECILLGYRESQTPATETDAHAALKAWHHKGEWFRLTYGSRKVIRNLLAIEFSDHIAEQVGVACE